MFTLASIKFLYPFSRGNIHCVARRVISTSHVWGKQTSATAWETYKPTKRPFDGSMSASIIYLEDGKNLKRTL